MLVTAVESSTLITVAYDCTSRVLRLQFPNHATYCYFGVPLGIYQNLMAAQSKGSYFNRKIRGHFPYQRQAHDRITPPHSLP
jgi:KTSC domain